MYYIKKGTKLLSLMLVHFAPTVVRILNKKTFVAQLLNLFMFKECTFLNMLFDL